MDDRFLFHVRERNTWPRITKMRHRCFAQQLDALDKSKHEVDEEREKTTGVAIQVRLQPFERFLLQDALDYLSDAPDYQQTAREAPSTTDKCIGDLDADVAGTILFFRWSWADNVLRQALTELDPSWVAEVHDGNFQSAIEVWKKQLRTRVRKRNDLYDRRYYRTEQLISDNQTLATADSVDIDKLAVVPHPEDLILWRLLGVYVLKNLDTMVAWPGFGVEAASLLELYRPGEDSFLSAVRNQVLERFEETPDFPPRDLSESADEAMGLESSDAGDGPDDMELSDEAVDSAYLVETDADRETTRDWAKITARNILDAEDLWDVWSWCRMALVSHQNMQHTSEMKVFNASKGVMEYWKIVEQPGKGPGGHRAIVSRKSISEILSKRPSEIANLLFHEDSQEYLDVEFRQQLHSQSIGDPKDYLHFIPWTALAELGTHEMENELDYGLGLGQESFPGTLCAYQPKAEIELQIHQLYLTDDLFPPHVEKDYRYPAYTMGNNKIVFLREKLTSSALIRQLGLFWELWNDTAITLDPSTNTFYLLQTLPGVKARILEAKAGIWSAFEFFDIRYRHRDVLQLQRSSLRDILGSKYNPAYADFMMYIDSRELDLKTNNLEEVGKGSFGRVYKAKWSKKPVKVYDHAEEVEGNVALKVAMGHKTLDAREDFFLELATTYSALGGDSSGCIPFYGFCKVIVDAEGQLLDPDISLPLPDGAMETFALVFDFADRGNLEGFLKGRLEPGKPDGNWLVICGALSSLASGIMTIHKKGVAHRDIHIRNVLVQTIGFPEEGEIEFDCLLSDLGEGKTCVDEDVAPTATEHNIASASQMFVTNADTPSISIPGVPPIPELVRRRRIHTAKTADIYSWGLLGIKIIRDNYKLLCDETGEAMYPAALMRVVERCIDKDPAGRLDAASLVLAMDEVLDGPNGLAAGDETEWFDGSYSLPEIRVKFGAGSDGDDNDALGSGWLNSVKTSGFT